MQINELSLKQAKRITDKIKKLTKITDTKDLTDIETDIAQCLDALYLAGMIDYKQSLKKG